MVEYGRHDDLPVGRKSRQHERRHHSLGQSLTETNADPRTHAHDQITSPEPLYPRRRHPLEPSRTQTV